MVPNNQGFSYSKWSFWGVLEVPPFKETRIYQTTEVFPLACGSLLAPFNFFMSWATVTPVSLRKKHPPGNYSPENLHVLRKSWYCNYWPNTQTMGVSKNRGISQNGWFIMEIPINPWMIWGEKYHHFRKHPYTINKYTNPFKRNLLFQGTIFRFQPLNFGRV